MCYRDISNARVRGSRHCGMPRCYPGTGERMLERLSLPNFPSNRERARRDAKFEKAEREEAVVDFAIFRAIRG